MNPAYLFHGRFFGLRERETVRQSTAQVFFPVTKERLTVAVTGLVPNVLPFELLAALKDIGATVASSFHLARTFRVARSELA